MGSAIQAIFEARDLNVLLVTDLFQLGYPFCGLRLSIFYF